MKMQQVKSTMDKIYGLNDLHVVVLFLRKHSESTYLLQATNFIYIVTYTQN